eukprot:CAMPEP_0178803218 /NCGR_PEP_ID=MMETSP0745-20121128/14343_1 /TAXON_ID=913974 /ORGANISM="Nitzschia punctata, Strain CCMP561" /LENGTH=112 /DNA_ID=CAMNT_0020462265 /DNA_START=47 /DNA_END=385 /DNA_ORIENTATION=-
MTNALGHPAEEKSVGLSFGDVNESSSFISFALRLQEKLSALCCSPSSHVGAVHVLVPSPKYVVGLTDTAAPLCNSHRTATCSGDLFPWALPMRFKMGLDSSSSFGPGSPTAP